MASLNPAKKTGVVKTTLTDAKSIRIKADGSMVASGVKRVDVVEAKDSETAALLRGEGANKPVTVGRALRKAVSWGTGGAGRGFFSGKSRRRRDDEEEDMEGAMDIEEAIERILEDGDGDCLYSNFTLIASFTLSIFMMVFALETNMLTYVGPCATASFYPDASYEELYIKETGLWDALYYGELVGALFWGPLGDSVGRWRILFISSLCTFTFGVLSAAATSYDFLYWTRFAVGFFEGGATIAIDMLAEFLPARDRGFILNFTNLGWGIGSVFICLGAEFCIRTWGPTRGWHYVILFAAFPMGVALFAMMWLVESPRYLLVQGKDDAAMRALRTMAKRNDVPMPCDRLITPEGVEPDTELENKAGTTRWYIYMKRFWRSCKALLSRKLWKRTLLIWILWFGSLGLYSGIVIFAADVMGEDDDGGIECSFNYNQNILLASSEIVGAVAIFPLIDKSNLGIWGGRFGAFWLTLLVSVAALLALGYDASPEILWTYLSRGGIAAASGVVIIATTEWYPSVCRATGSSIAYVVGIIGSISVTYWTYAYLPQAVIAYGLGLLAIITTIPVLFLPETVGLDLSSLDDPRADFSVSCNTRRIDCCGED